MSTDPDPMAVAAPTREPIAVVRAIAAVLYPHSREWLIVRGPRDEHWHLPGGGVGHDEAPSHALRRELHEELGLTVSHLNEGTCTWTAPKGPRPPQVNILFWTELSNPACLCPDPVEIAEYRWAPPHEASALVGPGDQQRLRMLRNSTAYAELQQAQVAEGASESDHDGATSSPCLAGPAQ